MTGNMILVVAIVVIDQITKYAVRHAMTVGLSFEVIKGFFAITYYRNDGAAFSSLKGQQQFLIAISLLAVIVTLVLMIRDRGEDKFFSFTMALVCGGGLGNLIDRVLFGEVTDMISFSFFPPIFNVADIAVVVGCSLAVIWVFISERKARG